MGLNLIFDKGQIVSWRRYFHQYPEIANEEKKTSSKVVSLLKDFGLEVKSNVGGYGVIAKLHGNQPGPTIALRADMDALPIHDEKNVPYCSVNPGKMHACGHDGHMAMLLGAAKFLSENRNRLKGEIRFIFQPAEEVIPGGAIRMIEENCLEGVDFIYGLHLWSGLPTGTIGLKAGPMMASSDFFNIEMKGKGGHGAQPHTTIDPIIVGMQVINQFQTIISRQVSPLSPCVLTVGSFHAGSANNVIADVAEMKGTVRCFDVSLRQKVKQLMEQTLQGVCSSYGASYKFEYIFGCPPVVNDSMAVEHFKEAVRNLVRDVSLIEMEPIMVGEDFASYLEKVPGCFAFIGSGNSSKKTDYPHHHAMFDLDEESLEIGTNTLISTVLHHCQT